MPPEKKKEKKRSKTVKTGNETLVKKHQVNCSGDKLLPRRNTRGIHTKKNLKIWIAIQISRLFASVHTQGKISRSLKKKICSMGENHELRTPKIDLKVSPKPLDYPQACAS